MGGAAINGVPPRYSPTLCVDVPKDSDGLAKNIQMETEYGLAHGGA